MQENLGHRLEWILFVAARSLSQKHAKSRVSSILSIFEIGAGVLALTVIIAVMNGFQLGFIENILEVSSYYIRIDNAPREQPELRAAIEDIREVTAIVPFIETQGIMHGNIEAGQCTALLRGVDENAILQDAGLNKHLALVAGAFDISTSNAVIIGVELAARLDVDIGDTIDYLSISNLFANEETANSIFTVTGIFRTGYYEYDANWGFININTAAKIEGDMQRATWGIKLKNRFHDNTAI
ncbi:MAG: ABC transporter permease, partial [Spirochaetaceae bacterium]|nr:ABC transporter permease [Spirochaetaceae bacterium]